MPRKAFLILYDADGRRRLASDVDRTPAQERAQFNELRARLPADIARAEYHDTDNRGLVLSITAPAEPPKPAESDTTRRKKAK